MTSRLLGQRRRGDGGFSAVEVVLLAPIFILLLLLIVVLGRMQQAGADVTGAARDGARAASLARSAPEATTAARQAVSDALAGQALVCQGGPSTAVDTSSFSPGGQVRVAVSCVVPLSDIGFSAMPGNRAMTRQAISPVETFRAP